MIIKKEHILNGLILVFAIFPLLPNKVKGLPVILLFLASVFVYKKSKINWKWLIINSSLFIIYLFSVIYSTNTSGSFKKLETVLSILIIPTSFFFFLPSFEITNFIKRLFIKLFIIATALFSMISVFTIFINDLAGNSEWNTDQNRVSVMDMALIGQHPIYASIFISLAIIFFIYILKNNIINAFRVKLFFLSLTILNVLMLFILFSKGVIIALFVIIFFYISISKMFKSHKYLAIVFMIISLVTIFIFSKRMNELIDPETYSEFNPNLSTSVRLGIYDCSVDIIKEKWLLGYGIGDAQRVLYLCYANKSDILLMHKFNSHNQYLDVMMKTGIFGLLIFLAFLTINFKEALQANNEIMLVIIIFYCIIFLTENILSRQSGVIFFFFLISLFNNSDKALYNKTDVTKS